MEKRILTGDRPTGKLHLGHYVGSLKKRVELQKDYDTLVLIADVQALTTNFEMPEKLQSDIYQVALDYLSVGIDPNISTIVLQSLIPEIAELTIFFSMFVTVNTLRHNPTTKTEIEEKGLKELMYGFLGYPVSQAADITIFKANCVPVGQDQLPHIEQTRKIVRRFNELYKPVLIEPEALLSEVSRLVGLDGKTKMSKSLNNCIYLSDTAQEIHQKVKTAITDPARIKKTDIGHPEICIIFEYQKAFNNPFIVELEQNCKEGKIGCVECKKIVAGKIIELLSPINEKRKEYENKQNLIKEILYDGTSRARKIAQSTMKEVREAMNLVGFK